MKFTRYVLASSERRQRERKREEAVCVRVRVCVCACVRVCVCACVILQPWNSCRERIAETLTMSEPLRKLKQVKAGQRAAATREINEKKVPLGVYGVSRNSKINAIRSSSLEKLEKMWSPHAEILDGVRIVRRI